MKKLQEIDAFLQPLETLIPLFLCFHSAIPLLAISRSSTSSTPDRLAREVEEGPDFSNRALTLKSRRRSLEVSSRRWTWSWSRERKRWRTRLRRRPANPQPRRRPTSLTRTSALTGPPAPTRRSGSYSSLTYSSLLILSCSHRRETIP